MKFERYGIGIAKGMALTFRHLFRSPITIQYPDEKLVTSKRIRGNELVWFPVKGKEYCKMILGTAYEEEFRNLL